MARVKKTKIKRRAKFLMIAILCLVVLTILVIFVKNQNRLQLIGDNPATINLEENYIEDGLTYQGKNVTEEVNVTANIDNKKPGTYEITYSYKTAKGKTLTAKRKVIVKDLTLPELTLVGGNEMIVIKGQAFQEPGYQAVDNVDGDLSKQVVVTGTVDTAKEGDYTLTYEVVDKAGNRAKKTRKVTVSTKSPLTMNLKEFTLDGMFQDTILPEKKASDDYMDKIIYVGDSMVLYYDINKLVPTKRLWYRNSIDPKTAQTATLYHLYKETDMTMAEMYAEEKPEISILTLGTNSVAVMEVETFIDNYKKLLQDIKKASPETKLIVQSIPPVSKAKDDNNSAINNDKINKFNYHIVAMCQELGVKFLNSAPAMKDEEGHAKEGYCIDYDGIHPSKVGHTALYNYTANHAFE